MSASRQSFVRHAAIYLAARGLPGVVAFIAIPLYSRLLDPAGYGRYALVVALVNLVGALFFQGLLLALVRYLPAYRDEPGRLKSTLLTAMLVLLGAAGACAAALCLVPGAEGWRPALAACWCLLAVQQLFDLFSEYARAQIRPWRYMGLQLARSAAATLAGGLLVLWGAGWMGAVAGTALGALLPLGLTWRRDWSGVRLTVDREVLRVVCRYSIPLSLTVALAVVISSTDRFLIAWLVDEHAAGLYAVAADLTARTLTLLMMVVYTATLPLAVRALAEGGADAARARMRDNVSLLLAAGLPAAAGLAVLAGNVTHCVLGESFRSAAATLMPLIAAGAFLGGLKAFHLDAAFQLADQTIHQVWIVAVAAAANLALNLVAIPRYGINGAAGASVVALALAVLLTALVGRRHFALPFPSRVTLGVVAATVGMVVALYPLRAYRGGPALAAQVTAGVCVYGLMLLALDVLGVRSYAAASLSAARRRARADECLVTFPAHSRSATAVAPSVAPAPAALEGT